MKKISTGLIFMLITYKNSAKEFFPDALAMAWCHISKINWQALGVRNTVADISISWWRDMH